MAASAVDAVDAFIAEQTIDTAAKNWRTALPQPPTIEFEAGQSVFWDLKTTMGDLTVRLMPEVAPAHVSSTIYLTRLGFYDGLSFHRVITEFMAQGGCPLGTGTGGPGYQYGSEFDTSVKHDRPGLLSMANAGQGTDGSQFFLISGPNGAGLPPSYSLFGKIVKGLDVLDEMQRVPTGGGDRPKTDVVIHSVTITTHDD